MYYHRDNKYYGLKRTQKKQQIDKEIIVSC